MKELEIRKIEELDHNTLYHINLAGDSHPEVIKSFANAAQKLDLKLFITLGDVLFERMCDVFAKLPDEQKEVVLKLLQPKPSIIKSVEFQDDWKSNGDLTDWEVNPKSHEQSK